MKISIITVCYNSAATLEETIKSVLSQSYPNIEYIIVDGASTDATPEILNRYADKISRIISEPDKGIYDAMNKGLHVAQGDVIGILNSDDLYHDPKVLENVVKAFQSDIDGLCTNVEIFDPTPDKVIRFYSCTKWRPWMFRIGHQPPHPGFFARKAAYAKVGDFDTTYMLAADFDFLLRFIFKHKLKMKYVPRVSVSMRSGGASQKSFYNIRKANLEDHHSLKKNGYFSLPIFIWLKYLIKIFQFSGPR